MNRMAKGLAIAAGVMLLAFSANYALTYKKEFPARQGGLTHVEYYRGPRAGQTCSFFPHDNWNQFPLICIDTKAAVEAFGYRKK